METNIDNLEYLILSVDRFLLKNNERVIEVEIDRGVNVLKTSSIEKWRQQNKNAGKSCKVNYLPQPLFILPCK